MSVLHSPPPSSRTPTGWEMHSRSWRVIAENTPGPAPVTARATNPADQLDARRVGAVLELVRDHYDVAAISALTVHRLQPSVAVTGLGIEVVLPRGRRAEFVAALAAILDATVTEPPVVPRRRLWLRRLLRV